tara:strand:+ start:1232 stop:1429 length:198 start_codon:yes stop_codon:yes gene_type:complete
MKKRTSDLLEQAHLTITDARGLDVPKYQLDEAYKKVRAIYRKIKEIEPDIYDVLNSDDNHKTIKK